MPPLTLWIRGITGMLCAIFAILVSLANAALDIIVVQDWIQAPLDKLYAVARGSVDALLAGARSGHRLTVVLATSPEPGAWQLTVRGDLLQWGKLGPPRVPFEEFLRSRLEAYGEVRMLPERPDCHEADLAEHEATIVVMPVGVSYPPDALDRIAALGTCLPLLLPVQSIGSRPLQKWPVLARQMRDRGITLSAFDDPVRIITVLHQATGKNVVFITKGRNQWGYIAAIHEAFRTISS